MGLADASFEMFGRGLGCNQSKKIYDFLFELSLYLYFIGMFLGI